MLKLNTFSVVAKLHRKPFWRPYGFLVNSMICINRSHKNLDFFYPSNHDNFRKAFLYNLSIKHSRVYKYSTEVDSISNQDNQTPFLLADIGEGIAEVQILKWYVKPDDKIAEFDKICEVQSDKAAVEITSPFTGTVVNLCAKEGGLVKVGQPLLNISVSKQNGTAKSKPDDRKKASTDTDTAGMKSRTNRPDTSFTSKIHSDSVLATPIVRQLAKSLSIDLEKVKGSGPDGRILAVDVENYKSSGSVSSASRSDISSQPESSLPEHEVAPLSLVQKSMVKSMEAAMKVPHFGYCEVIQLDHLLLLHSQMKTMLEKDIQKDGVGKSFTMMSLWIKITSFALSKFPILNSTYSLNKDNILTFKHHNIGIAMDTPKGLLVPVIKNVDEKSLHKISQDLNELQRKGMAGSLTREDLQGGTLTLSNIGAIGTGVDASPLLVVPQLCIGAMTRMERVIAVTSDPPLIKASESRSPSEEFSSHSLRLEGMKDGEHLKIATIFKIHWSADHRIIDGGTLSRFSSHWKSLAESPSFLLSHLK